jgi:inner membrane protein involved in colicin E2 resistance
MVKRIVAIVFIYVCTTVAWVILGGSVAVRTETQDGKLKRSVGQLWGTVQKQQAPEAYYETVQRRTVETAQANRITTEVVEEKTSHDLPLDSSKIDANLKLDYRRKGLLWYSTYRVEFSGEYRITNTTRESREIFFIFAFPIENAVYDDFHLVVGGKEVGDVQISEGRIKRAVRLSAGESQQIRVSYKSQGMDQWWYSFGEGVSQVKNFGLTMKTDFDKIDFPQASISPTSKKRTGSGWTLKWDYSNLLSGVQIGMEMPKKLNPGPWVSEVTFTAPVSLFLFFFLLFVLTTVQGLKVHPMNYFFVGAAFFSFHLLLAYLVDHVSIHWAFAISSAVSVVLVVSYMCLVVSPRFALMEIAVSQLVYLVLFSYTFFFEGYTGLAITILCVLTLFIVMQYTGRVDWEEIFRKNGSTPLPTPVSNAAPKQDLPPIRRISPPPPIS